MSDYLKAIQERVIIFDGAMGTNIQLRNPSLDDFRGKEGYNDILVLSRPDLIADIHSAFYKVGCDVVETNTFNSTRIVMAEYQMEADVHEVNLAAAKLAREVADSFSYQGSQALRCRIHGSHHQASVTRPHHLGRHGLGLYRAGARAD